ncbi:hypothetical protein V8G54_001782, partial [Vigna mungo]
LVTSKGFSDSDVSLTVSLAGSLIPVTCEGLSASDPSFTVSLAASLTLVTSEVFSASDSSFTVSLAASSIGIPSEGFSVSDVSIFTSLNSCFGDSLLLLSSDSFCSGFGDSGLTVGSLVLASSAGFLPSDASFTVSSTVVSSFSVETSESLFCKTHKVII